MSLYYLKLKFSNESILISIKDKKLKILPNKIINGHHLNFSNLAYPNLSSEVILEWGVTRYLSGIKT